MITFTAFNVGELGNKSIKAWLQLSSKYWVRLRSSRIEPTRRRKIVLSRYESETDSPLWKQVDFGVKVNTSVRILCNLQRPLD